MSGQLPVPASVRVQVMGSPTAALAGTTFDSKVNLPTAPLKAAGAPAGSGFTVTEGRSLVMATDGPLAFYAWMTLLTAVALVGVNAWAHQVTSGMILTHMTDHVSWGLYIANFTFGVGLAAGGVMMVIPAYLYHDRRMHDVVILGELLAVAAIVVSRWENELDLGVLRRELGRAEPVADRIYEASR